MTLIEFYIDILKSLGLAEEDGYIFAKFTNGKLLPLVEDKKQFVLPTKDQLGNLMEEDDDGNAVLARIPYNPLNEDVVKGDSMSLKKTKYIVERKIGHCIAYIGELLLRLAMDGKLQNKTRMDINSFLKAINRAKGQNIKAVVDEKSIDSWTAIYKSSLTAPKGMAFIYLKKAGENVEGKKFNRLAVMSSPVYDEIVKAEKNPTILGVTLRNKDKIVFEEVIKFILNDLNENNTIEIGSNDKDCPGFIALYRLYLKIAKRANNLVTSLKHVAVEAMDNIIELPITEDDLTELGVYKNELALIPNENELDRPNVAPSRITGNDGALYNRTVGTSMAATTTTTKTTTSAYPSNPVDYNYDNSNDAAASILSVSRAMRAPVPNIYQPQAMGAPYQPPYQQPAPYAPSAYPEYQPPYGGYRPAPYGQQQGYGTYQQQPTFQDPNLGYPNTGNVGSVFQYR